ncbi:MAG TPA: FMN-binding protein [Candidatus Dormibacteraeota bacterium]
MKRAITALVATVAGVAWLVTFRVTPHARPVASAPASQPPPASQEPVADAPAPATTPTPTPRPTPANRPADGSFTGPTVPTRYGDVQVRIAISGGRLADVSVLRMPDDRARSAEITQYVTPVLRSEAIQAQSARIDIISGATFTSEAYAESLDAALRQDHLG